MSQSTNQNLRIYWWASFLSFFFSFQSSTSSSLTPTHFVLLDDKKKLFVKILLMKHSRFSKKPELQIVVMWFLYLIYVFRMTSLGNATNLISSADDQIGQIAGKLDGLLQEPLDISSFALAHGGLLLELKVLQWYEQWAAQGKTLVLNQTSARVH